MLPVLHYTFKKYSILCWQYHVNGLWWNVANEMFSNQSEKIIWSGLQNLNFYMYLFLCINVFHKMSKLSILPFYKILKNWLF